MRVKINKTLEFHKDVSPILLSQFPNNKMCEEIEDVIVRILIFTFQIVPCNKA